MQPNRKSQLRAAQQSLRERRKAAGLKRLELWVDDEARAEILDFAARLREANEARRQS